MKKLSLLLTALIIISFTLLDKKSYTQEKFQLQKKNYIWNIDNESIQLPFKDLSGIWKIESISTNEYKFALTQKLQYIDFTKLLSEKSFYDFTFTAKIYLKEDENIKKLNKKESASSKKDKEYYEEDESIAAGLIFRYRNNFKYYMIFIDATENEIDLIRNNYGKKIIKKINYTIDNNKWYKLSIKCYLDEIVVSLDDKEMYRINDSASTGGKIGLVTYKRTTAYFNDLTLETEVVSTSKGDILQDEQ